MIWIFWIVLITGVVCVPIYKAINPEGFTLYLVWVVFIEILNYFMFFPFKS